MRAVAPVFGIMLALLGFATAGSAQVRKEPERLCEEFNLTEGDVFLGRVVAFDHAVQPPRSDMGSSPPPMRVDAVRAVVLESFRGQISAARC